MKATRLEIPDVVLIEPRVFSDDRGFFLETYQKFRYNEAIGLECNFVQDNHSYSKRGVLRGLHYQLSNPQGKLVSVISGEIFDVAVDIRRPSCTFGRWVGVHLSGTVHNSLWIPPGFAHGFLVLSEEAHVIYKVTELYDPKSEASIAWNDVDLGINWPKIDFGPFLSPKDALGKSLKLAEVYS